MEPAHKTMGSVVGERRRMPRYHLLTRVDILLANRGDVYWGSLGNVSRTGVALSLRHPLKTGQTVTIRFRSEDGRETTETLPARVIWRSGDNTGLEFEIPLTTGSPALQQAPYLAANLVMKEAGR